MLLCMLSLYANPSERYHLWQPTRYSWARPPVFAYKRRTLANSALGSWEQEVHAASITANTLCPAREGLDSSVLLTE